MHISETLAKTSKSLMMEEPFYGLFLLTLNKDTSERIETACVSKNHLNIQLTINPKFWDEIEDTGNATRIGVLKHELLHIAMQHLTMCDSFPDKTLFNIAADLEINQYIKSTQKGIKWMGLELSAYPELKLPPKAGTKAYYEILDKVNGQRPQNGQQGQGQEGQEQGGEKQGQSKNDGSSPGKSKIWDVYDAMKQGQKSIYSHELWKEFTENLSEAERKLIQKQIDYQLKRVAEEVQKSKGNIPGELKDLIDELFRVEEPVLDWKSYIRRFGGRSNKIYTKKSRHKYNKRFSDNPALKIKPKKTLLFALDTSGSMSKQDFDECWSELVHLYKTGVQIDIAEIDTVISRVYRYNGKPPEFIMGRGGTDMTPAISYYNEHYKKYGGFILLTDGFIPVPSEKSRTHMLWIISSNGAELNALDEVHGLKVKIQRSKI